MHYEINVSLNGRHFFATHDRSIKSRADFEKVLDVLKMKFKKDEGFEISASYVTTTHEGINVWGDENE